MCYGFWGEFNCTVHQVEEDGACAVRSMLACIGHNKWKNAEFNLHDEPYWVAMSIEQMLFSGGDIMSDETLNSMLKLLLQ